MSKPYLSIGRVERRFTSGGTEDLSFAPGVNVLVGPPNTGKTKWLETIDYLLGDPDKNPFHGAEEAGLDKKYDATSAELIIGEESFTVQRRWLEQGAMTKIFVDDEDMATRDFQHWLLDKLEIPLVHFPKGNPMSGRTWPELSFRMLLRHMHRRQRMWGDLADQQPDGEQHACLLQFLGLAEVLFSEDYARLIELTMKADRLKARRDQYGDTLDEIARDVLAEPGLSVSVTATTVRHTGERLHKHIAELRERRQALLADAQQRAVESAQQSRVTNLGSQRAENLAQIEDVDANLRSANERLTELHRYKSDLAEELDRITRAEDAGAVLSDLKVTHCPACDQSVSQLHSHANACFLCHQDLPSAISNGELGAVRIRFERDRLSAELKEAEELSSVLTGEAKALSKELIRLRDRLQKIENELAPARQAVAALVQDEVSALDMALGEAHERQTHLSRITEVLKVGETMTEEIKAIEKEIEPIQEKVNQGKRAIDFDERAAALEEGMNAYFNAINALRPNVWRHSPARVDVSSSGFKIRVGTRTWSAVLGGTDTLYFLMAYHYGLLSLSRMEGFYYPGLSIIDVPGEFSGEAVEDKENFIVQPFIDLLRRKEYEGAQLIISGASFAGLEGASRRVLSDVHVA